MWGILEVLRRAARGERQRAIDRVTGHSRSTIRRSLRIHILVASLADVIRSKEAAGREKDRLALPRPRRLLDRLREGE